MLFELLLVFCIIALMTVNFFINKKNNNKPVLPCDIMKEISTITQKALVNSILNKKIYQVRFFFNEEMKLVEVAIGALENINAAKKQNNFFEFKEKFKYDITIKKFVINNKNEVESSRTRETWILIYPDGYSQEVEIDYLINNSIELGLQKAILNPFTVVLQENQND